MGIIILGTGKRYSSLDSYAEDFSSASGRPRVVLRLSKDQRSSNWEGNIKVVDGMLACPYTDCWSINILLGSKIFRGLEKEIAKNIVHYTTFGLPLLSKNKEDIVTIHDLFFLDRDDEAHTRLINISAHFLNRFKNFRNVIAPSKFVKTELERNGFTGDISVIYIPPQRGLTWLNRKDELRKAMGLPADKKLILSVSSNLRRKNIPTVLKTIKLLGDDFELIRIGPPIDGVRNFSNLTLEQINHLYNACDVLLFPSFKEGFGKPIIEAFSTGLPVVASDISVFREIAGDSAILVEPTPDKCAKGVKQALDNSEQLTKLGLERAKFFSREKFKIQVTSYYSRIIENI